MNDAKKNLLLIPILILLVNICLAATAVAQQPTKTPENFKPRTDIPLEQQQENNIRQRERALRNAGNLANRSEDDPIRILRKTSPDEMDRQREATENWNNIMQQLSPPNAYYERFSDLLKDEDFHLARLFIDKNCDAGKTVAVEELERCDGVPPVKGGGSFYSFRFGENYVYGSDWWDVHFVGDRFAVGNDTVQTIIADIGKIHLLDVNLKTKAFEFLKKYKPVQTLAEIKEANRLLEKGIESNHFTYSNSAVVNYDSTYIVRSIAYQFAEEPKQIMPGRGLDTFAAFKVVGRESDGSLVILWKHFKTDLPRRELK